MKYTRPSIKVKPPGPRAREIISRDEKVVSQSNWRYLPLVIKDGQGSLIEDVDGNVFLDFNSGAATQALGIDHPEIVESLKRQADGLATYQPIPGYFYDEVVVHLCEKLARMTPGKYEKKISLGLSGADATDTAMKLSRWHTKRKRFISFLGSNHGLGTYGALSVSGYSAGTVRGFSPLVPEVTHIPFPYPYRSKEGQESGQWVLDYLEGQVFRTVAPPDEVAGIFVEPVQGDGGVLMPPEGFLEGLQELCKRHGIMFIVDEVQTGFGRTGRMFASDHWKLEPDILLLGKPLGGGTPVSACVARSEVMDWPHGSHVMTGAGHPLGCAGALSMIRVLERERLWKNAARVGSLMKDRYLRMKEEYEIVGDVRGLGLLIGVEIVVSKTSKEPGVEAARSACLRAFQNGLVTAYDGLYGNVFRITPALNITEELAGTGLDIMERAIAAVQRARKAS